MKKDSTFLALELLHFTKSEAKAIKKRLKNIEDIHLYEKDERLFLYPVIQEVIDVLANVESEKLRLQFVWLDVSTGQVKDSDLSNKVIEFEEANIDDEKNRTNFFNKTFDYLDLDPIMYFLDKNPDVVDAEEATLVEDGSGGTAPSSIDPFIEEGNNEDDLNILENEDILDETSNEETTESKSNSDDIPDDFLDDIPDDFDNKSNDFSDDSDLSEDDLFESVFGDDEDDFDDEPLDSDDSKTQHTDPLLEAAQSIFNRKTVKSKLPNFSDADKELVSDKILNTKIAINDAENKAINAIYNVLKESYDSEYNSALGNELKEADEKHTQNLNKLKDNLTETLKNIELEEQKAFDLRKKEAGEAQLADFYAKYDMDHLDELHSAIQSRSTRAREESDKEIEQEGRSLEQYRDEVKKSIFEHVTNNVDIDKIINEYVSTVEEEKSNLINNAKNETDENIKLKEQVKMLKNTLTIQKETYNNRLNAEVAQRVAEANERNAKRVREVEEQLHLERKKFDDQVNLTNELNQKLMQANTTQYNPPNINSIPIQNNNQMVPADKEVNDTPQKNKKSSAVGKILAGAVGGLATLLLVGGSLFVKNQMTLSAQPTVVETSNSQESLSSSGNKDSFIYTTKDGKKYKVTKDSDNSGHYRDDDGKYHTVLFNK